MFAEAQPPLPDIIIQVASEQWATQIPSSCSAMPTEATNDPEKSQNQGVFLSTKRGVNLFIRFFFFFCICVIIYLLKITAIVQKNPASSDSYGPNASVAPRLDPSQDWNARLCYMPASPRGKRGSSSRQVKNGLVTC